jgi:YihY family inner membrane protein
MQRALDRHPGLRLLLQNIARDNIGMLAGYVSWNILTSIIPLSVAVVAISSLFVHDAGKRADLVSALSRLFQGAISTHDIDTAVQSLSQHSGLLGIAAVLGVLWGASNIGGSFSTAFRVIFETRPRPFVREKLVDVVMLFVFTGLMTIILFGTTAAAFLDHIAAELPFPEAAQVVLVAAVSFVSAFVLFSAIYSVFPNIEAGEKLKNVWAGALLAAVLFQIVTIIWPIYVRFSHASRFGAFLFALIVLTAWLFAFSMILLLGAEVIAVGSQRDRHPRPKQDQPDQQEVS